MASEEENKPQQTEPKEKGLLEDFLGDVFNLDRGLPATFLGMIKKPGEVIQSYFTDRGRFVNPFRYTIFLLAISTFIMVMFVDYEQIFTAAMEAGAGDSTENLILMLEEKESDFNWRGYFDALTEVSVLLTSKLNQILYIVVLAPILAFWSRLFFKGKQSEFRKHYVMMLYTMATFSLFGLLMIPLLLNLESFGQYAVIAVLVQATFTFYVQIRYLMLKGIKDILLLILSFVLSYITYSIVTALITYIGALLLVLVRG